MILRPGNRSKRVAQLQQHLNQILNLNLVTDGQFGPQTTKALKAFQRMEGLAADGILGPKTNQKLQQRLHALQRPIFPLQKQQFVVFVDAGHGGLDDDGKYTTAGKYAFHPEAQLHNQGHYYEGYENRLIAEQFIKACAQVGIMCIRTYHPYEDTPLAVRTKLVRDWLKRGYYGCLHSFHSNAISSTNTAEKLEKTQGFMVFNTKGDNFSDQIASRHFLHVQEAFQDRWILRKQLSDGDVDFEANFKILRETDLSKFNRFGAILEEWGFHSSKQDALFITDPAHRALRVACALKTARWVRMVLG